MNNLLVDCERKLMKVISEKKQFYFYPSYIESLFNFLLVFLCYKTVIVYFNSIDLKLGKPFLRRQYEVWRHFDFTQFNFKTISLQFFKIIFAKWQNWFSFQAINMCTLGEEESKTATSSGVPLHVKLVLEWDMPAKTQVINDDSDQIEEHASVKQVIKN